MEDSSRIVWRNKICRRQEAVQTSKYRHHSQYPEKTECNSSHTRPFMPEKQGKPLRFRLGNCTGISTHLHQLKNSCGWPYTAPTPASSGRWPTQAFHNLSRTTDVSAPSKPRFLRFGWESTIVRLPSNALHPATDSPAETQSIATAARHDPILAPFCPLIAQYAMNGPRLRISQPTSSRLLTGPPARPPRQHSSKEPR